MKYDLVFEGGGAKGIVFVGALQELFDRGHTVGRLIGTSAGAITATLLAAGYRGEEILDAVNEKLPDGKPRFSAFMDIPEDFDRRTIDNSITFHVFNSVDLPFVPQLVEDQLDKRITDTLLKLPIYRQVFSFTERGGLFAGDNFLQWIKEKLNAGGRNLGAATLEEFNRKTGVHLSVVASDTTGEEMLVLNHHTAPGVPAIWAVRMSMSIPFVWQEVRWDPNWGRYRGRNIAGHTIVDGGVLSNFPIELYLSDGEEVKELMGTEEGSDNVLGLLIDESKAVPGVSGDKQVVDEKSGIDLQSRWFIVLHRITDLINTMTNARDNLAMETYKEFICRLPAKGYGTTEFDMEDAKIQKLIGAGQEAMKTYFNQQNIPGRTARPGRGGRSGRAGRTGRTEN